MMNKMVRSCSVFFLSLTVFFGLGLGKVVLMGNNVTTSFEDIEANFAPAIRGSGECGLLYVAEPLDACSPLINKVNHDAVEMRSPFVLIIRGQCSFEDKVRRAQAAGYKAAIIYDDADGDLVTMAGNAAGIKIHAVFVSKASGEILTKYAGVKNIELWIIPSFENSAWSIMAISFISLLAVSAVLATCFFVRRHRIRRERPQSFLAREFQGMSVRRVKAMPSLKFTAVATGESSTSATCAICLDDYKIGDRLRILPCCHKFHASCVDGWLTTWRTFCPVCKRDARTSTGEPPASEGTPLLSSRRASFASSSVLSSARSSLASSSAIQIVPSSYRSSPSGSHIHAASVIQSSYRISPSSRIHSVSSTPYMRHSLQSSFRQSPSMIVSRSSMDLINAYSQRSPASHLVSPYSVAYPSVSPLNNRYMSPYIHSPVNASSYVGSSYFGSSSRHQNPLHCSESATSFSPFNSAQSLPGC